MKKHHTHARTQIFPFLRNIAFLSAILLTVGCEEIPKEVEITHQRELCKFDENEALRGAVNRFKAKQPIHWRRLAETKNRILNYRVGENTEVALGSFRGSVKSNIIRWYGQYGQTVTVPNTTEELKPGIMVKHGTMIGNSDYYLLDIKGKFETSMGGVTVKQDDWSTVGIICQYNDEELITIKMTGPTSETAKEKKNLIKFAEDLKFITFPEDKQ